MRSHVTPYQADYDLEVVWFQYRKRYEITCDWSADDAAWIPAAGFNTASGMRSHVTRL